MQNVIYQKRENTYWKFILEIFITVFTLNNVKIKTFIFKIIQAIYYSDYQHRKPAAEAYSEPCQTTKMEVLRKELVTFTR